MVNRKKITIRKEWYYPHPPADVWVALTDPHALAEWFEPNNHKAEKGHQFEFVTDAGPCGSRTECEVLEVEPERRLVWKWIHHHSKPGKPPADPMTIEWILDPQGDGTNLKLVHSGAENISWMHRTMMRMGWPMIMKKLFPKALANVDGGAFTPGAIPLNKRYYKCETVPDKYVR